MTAIFRLLREEMKILITGAAGSMSYYLADFIKNKVEARPGEHVVYGIGRKPIKKLDNFDQYDALNIYWQPPSRITEYINEIKPDIVFHLAAIANVRQSFNEPRKFVSNNAGGTLNLLDGIVKSKYRPRIVHASTSEVYGNVPASLNPIRECEPFAPVNFYAASKTMQEIIFGTYAKVHDLEFVITRAFGYINSRREDLVATSLARQLVKYERGEIDEVRHGNLDPIRSFCDARDIAEAYWLAATRCDLGIYNIGSSEPCSIAMLALMLRTAAGLDNVPMVKDETLMRPTDIFACWPDVSKFRIATGWKPRRRLSESLKWLMECVRA